MQKIHILILTVLLVAGGILWIRSFQNSLEPAQNGNGGVACTQDAKQCPDGSYVGRIEPNCEFAACPSPVPTPGGQSGMEGNAVLGPTCPVERIPPDPRCADKPFVGALAVTTVGGAHVLKEFNTDAAGNFSVILPAGAYEIHSVPGQSMLPRCASNGTIIVGANRYATTTIYCDTGIR